MRQQVGHLRQSRLQGGHRPLQLLLRRLPIGLGEDLAHHPGDQGLGVLGRQGHGVPREVHRAALPGDAHPLAGDGGTQARMVVAGDQLDRV